MGLFVDSLTALLLTGALAGVLMYHRKRQRLLINSLIALLLMGILGSMVIHHRGKRRLNRQHGAVHQSLTRLHEKAMFYGALEFDAGFARTTVNAFPSEISPVWFRDEGLPMNATVPGWLPWLDMAPVGDLLDHPPDPVIEGSAQAGFWYNPNTGLFRARVVSQHSQQATLELYNRLNQCNLTRLPVIQDHSRRARPLFSNPTGQDSQRASAPDPVGPQAHSNPTTGFGATTGHRS